MIYKQSSLALQDEPKHPSIVVRQVSMSKQRRVIVQQQNCLQGRELQDLRNDSSGHRDERKGFRAGSYVLSFKDQQSFADSQDDGWNIARILQSPESACGFRLHIALWCWHVDPNWGRKGDGSPPLESQEPELKRFSYYDNNFVLYHRVNGLLNLVKWPVSTSYEKAQSNLHFVCVCVGGQQ